MRTMTKGTAKRIAAEALAIALGVFLSLWADEWRTSRAEAAEGRESLARVALNLATDTARLGDSSRRSARGVEAIRAILTADPTRPATPRRIAEEVPWVLNSVAHRVSRTEYDALVNSGKLGFIEDADLLADIAAYYARQEFLARIYDFDFAQTRLVAELMYPHVESPRDRFLNPPDSAIFVPTPTTDPSVVRILDSSVFVSQMAHLGTLKEIAAAETLAVRDLARELIQRIDEVTSRQRRS